MAREKQLLFIRSESTGETLQFNVAQFKSYPKPQNVSHSFKCDLASSLRVFVHL